MEKKKINSAAIWLVYGATAAVLALFCFVPETRSYSVTGSTEREIAALRPWAASAISWGAPLCTLASLVLSILLFRRRLTAFAVLGLVVVCIGFPCAFGGYVVQNIGGWTHHGEIVTTSGDRYVFWDSSFLQGQTMAIARDDGGSTFWTYHRILVQTNGDSPRSWASIVRPAGSADEYGQLYLTPDNLVVGVRYDNHCFLAYGIDDGKGYGRESIESFSPFVCLGADSEIRASDVDLAIGCIEEWKKQCADDKDIRPTAGFLNGAPQAGCPSVSSLEKALQHKNPRVRAAAQRILDRYAYARRRLEPRLAKFVTEQSDLLLSPSAEVRRSAAARLGDAEAAGAPAIPRLAQLVLSDPDTMVRSGSAQTLGIIGAAAVPTLVKLAKSDQPSVCKDALFGLVTAGAAARTEGVVACLKELRSHPDPEVREYSDRVLEKILAEPDAAGR